MSSPPTFTPPPPIRLENVCDGYGSYACLHGKCVLQSDLLGNTSSSTSGSVAFRTTSNLTTCVCNPGYTHDYLFTRLENCAVPDWFERFTFSTSVVCGVVALLVIAKYYRGLRGSAFYTVCALCFTLASNVCMAIVHLADGYLSIPSYFFLMSTMVGFGMLFGVFSEAVFLVTKHSFVLASMGDGEPVDKATQVRIEPIRKLFAIQAVMIPLPWIVIWGVAASLGEGAEPDYDVETFNLLLVIAYPLMLLHNVIYFPSFLWLVSTFVKLIDASMRRRSVRTSMTSMNTRIGANNNSGDGVPASPTTALMPDTALDAASRSSRDAPPPPPRSDALNLGSRLADLKYRLNRFKTLAIFVLAPGELLFCVFVIPVYSYKLPAMYLVVFFGTAMANFSIVVLLLTVRGKKKKYFPAGEEEEEDETGGRRMVRNFRGDGRENVADGRRGEKKNNSNNNKGESEAKSSTVVMMMRMQVSNASSSSFQ